MIVHSIILIIDNFFGRLSTILKNIETVTTRKLSEHKMPSNSSVPFGLAIKLCCESEYDLSLCILEKSSIVNLSNELVNKIDK